MDRKIHEVTYHATGDGYLLGLTRDRIARVNSRYWHPTGCEFDDCEIRTVDINVTYQELADLESIGTSEQVHSDGYEAYRTLRDRTW